MNKDQRIMFDDSFRRIEESGITINSPEELVVSPVDLEGKFFIAGTDLALTIRAHNPTIGGLVKFQLKTLLNEGNGLLPAIEKITKNIPIAMLICWKQEMVSGGTTETMLYSEFNFNPKKTYYVVVHFRDFTRESEWDTFSWAYRFCRNILLGLEPFTKAFMDVATEIVSKDNSLISDIARLKMETDKIQ